MLLVCFMQKTLLLLGIIGCSLGLVRSLHLIVCLFVHLISLRTMWSNVVSHAVSQFQMPQNKARSEGSKRFLFFLLCLPHNSGIRFLPGASYNQSPYFKEPHISTNGNWKMRYLTDSTAFFKSLSFPYTSHIQSHKSLHLSGVFVFHRTPATWVFVLRSLWFIMGFRKRELFDTLVCTHLLSCSS